MRTITTLDDFHALVKSESPKLVVVDFFAEWCGPCKRVAPQYAQLAEIHSKTACFVKVDVDASPELSSFGRISAMPTFQVYKGGERVAEVKGARMDELERSIALWGADVERQLAAAAAAAATHVPLQQSLLDHSLLTAAEREWIDAYHAQVWERVSPLLDEGCEGRAWLREATQPLGVPAGVAA